MAAEWSNALFQRTAEEAETAEDPGIWSEIKETIQITSYHPQPNPDVINKRLHSRRGDYYVLKNTVEKTYLRLSPREFELWRMMDGEKSVHDLIVEHYMQTSSFAHNNVIHLVQQLLHHQMLSERSIAVWSQVAGKVQSRSWLFRISSPARALLTQRLNINGIDKWITKLYKFIGWIFFTRPMILIFILVSLIGFIAYARIIDDPSYVFLGDNLIIGITTLWIVSIIPVLVHELGHALTVKHYGREVPRGGVMLFFGMPAAFVETTDIWLEPRKARLAVTWNGPFTGLILGGIAALLMYLNPDSPFNNLLFKFAGFAYFTVFININPLLKLDGYYLLADALDISSLRDRSIGFVRQKFFKKLLGWEKFSRDEILFSVFGLLSLLWTVYAISLAFFFWRTRLEAPVRTLMNAINTGEVPLLASFLSILTIAAMGSFLFLISVQLLRMGRTLISRFSKSGNLEKHRRLALVLGTAALLLGFGVPVLFNDAALQLTAGLGVIASLSSALLLINYSRDYMGSPRGFAFQAIGIGLVISGLALGLRLVINTENVILWSQWISLFIITAGFIFLSRSTLDWKTFSIGLVAMLLWYVFLEYGLGSNRSIPFKMLSSLLLFAGIYSIGKLRGSARTPSVLLLSFGAVCVSFSWMNIYPSIDFAFAGTLLIAAGCLHLIYARLPRLSSLGEIEITSDTRWSVGISVGILIRRIIAQVFFETGFAGVERFARAFGKSMNQHGIDIRIRGNVFYDNELPNRSTDELLEVYGIVFDSIHDYICTEFGRKMGTLIFGMSIDLLPWEYREIVSELILSRRHWGLSISQRISESQEERRRLLRRITLFSELSSQEMDYLAAALEEKRFAAGEFVIRQGEVGDKFYIIDHGVAEIRQRDSDGIERHIDRLGGGHYFGEMALISDAPRNASIRAETPLSVLSLDRDSFDRLLKNYINLEQQLNTRVRYSWLLRGMPIFDDLSGMDIDLIASRLEVEKYQPNTELFHEGDHGDKFYIVASGQLSIVHEVDGKQVEVSRRGPGDYFGEIALIENRPRTATVVTLEETELLSLKAEYFQDIVNSFLQIGETLSMTGSRRLKMIKRVDSGLIPTS